MKNKYSLLFKDTMLFILSTFLPKAISFFLVPLYTNKLTTLEYGVVDILSTTISFLIPILTLCISDAVLRFTIENKEDNKPYQLALKFAIVGFIILILLLFMNFTLNIFSIQWNYQLYFILNYILLVVYSINMAYLRATDRVMLLSIVSIVNTFVTVFANVITLAVLDWGIFGYLFSNIFGLFITNLIIFKKIFNKKLLSGFNENNSKLLNQMVSYSAPLVASGIAWWVNSASDRYFVSYICGMAANGIYSVAYKIPTILQMLQGVFYQSWLLSLYREYQKEDSKIYISKIYDLYTSSMVLTCSLLIVLTIPLAKILYAKDFFEAWRYVPFLLISVVFIANAGFYESILTLFRKTKTVAITTVIGAVSNIALNYILIKEIGPLGAAIATAVGYFIMWITRIFSVNELFSFYVSWKKHIVLFSLLIIQAIVMVKYENIYLCVILFLFIVIINLKTIWTVFNVIFKKISELFCKSI